MQRLLPRLMSTGFYPVTGTLFHNSPGGRNWNNPQAAVAWPTTNLGLFVPILFTTEYVVKALGIRCAVSTSSSNQCDLGLFTPAGTRVCWTQPFYFTGTYTGSDESIQYQDLHAPIMVSPGVYYMGAAIDGTTNVESLASADNAILQMMGVRQMSSAFPLPSTVTYATLASTMYPEIFARSFTYDQTP